MSMIFAMCSFALSMSISPGPVNLLTLSSGINHGFLRTLPFVAGRDAADPTPAAAERPKSAAQQAKKPAKKAPAKKAAPKPEKAAAGAAEVKEKAPRRMKAARKAGADDLKQLKGVGPKLEQTLNELGFYHFDQIAKWTEAEVAWVDTRLKFKGRITRDGWIEQAKILAEGGETEFSRKVSKGDTN